MAQEQKKANEIKKENAIEKKNRCSRFGRSLGVHNLTNRIHIQLHLPDEICYLSCSSKCFIFYFFLQLIFFISFLFALCSSHFSGVSSILFVHGLCRAILRVVILLCVCALLRDHFRSTFSSLHSACLMIMLQKPVRRFIFSVFVLVFVFFWRIFQHASCFDSVLARD